MEILFSNLCIYLQENVTFSKMSILIMFPHTKWLTLAFLNSPTEVTLACLHSFFCQRKNWGLELYDEIQVCRFCFSWKQNLKFNTIFFAKKECICLCTLYYQFWTRAWGKSFNKNSYKMIRKLFHSLPSNIDGALWRFLELFI